MSRLPSLLRRCAIVLLGATLGVTAAEPANLIFDTDIGNDVDRRGSRQTGSILIEEMTIAGS